MERQFERTVEGPHRQQTAGMEIERGSIGLARQRRCERPSVIRRLYDRDVGEVTAKHRHERPPRRSCCTADRAAAPRGPEPRAAGRHQRRGEREARPALLGDGDSDEGVDLAALERSLECAERERDGLRGAADLREGAHRGREQPARRLPVFDGSEGREVDIMAQPQRPAGVGL